MLCHEISDISKSKWNVKLWAWYIVTNSGVEEKNLQIFIELLK